MSKASRPKRKGGETTIRIRPMTKEDMPRVLNFFEEVNPTATREQIAGWTSQLLLKWPKLSWVAVEEGRVVGAITASLRGHVPFIEDLFVEESYRRRGVGSRLLSRVLKELGRLKAAFVKVEANPSEWPLAMKFYYRHGFRVCGVEQDRFGVGPRGDAVILKRPLP